MARTNTAENAKLQREAGQTLIAMVALTDSGDKTTFTAASKPWSRKSGFEAKVYPNGMASNGAVTPTSGQNDKVDIAALTGYLAGVLTSVGAGAATAVTRGATNVSKISSVTISSAGAIAVIAGTDGTTSAFSETRGAAGGPPFIPVGSFEVAQVRLATNVAGVITADEIFAVPGQHSEWSNYPIWDENTATGTIAFSEALPASHTGSLPKGVYAKYYTPSFADISLSSGFTPPENSYSVSSTQIYSKTLGKTTSSLSQGKFTAYLEDAITDPIVLQAGEILWFRFYPDKHKAPYILTQGKLGISRTFPAGDNIMASCSISAEQAATGMSA